MNYFTKNYSINTTKAESKEIYTNKIFLLLLFHWVFLGVSEYNKAT